MRYLWLVCLFGATFSDDFKDILFIGFLMTYSILEDIEKRMK